MLAYQFEKKKLLMLFLGRLYIPIQYFKHLLGLDPGPRGHGMNRFEYRLFEDAFHIYSTLCPGSTQWLTHSPLIDATKVRSVIGNGCIVKLFRYQF